MRELVRRRVNTCAQNKQETTVEPRDNQTAWCPDRGKQIKWTDSEQSGASPRLPSISDSRNHSPEIPPKHSQTGVAGDSVRTCVHLLELLFELSGRQPVLVQSVLPVDPVQHLQVSPHQPVPAFHHHLGKKNIYILMSTAVVSWAASPSHA